MFVVALAPCKSYFCFFLNYLPYKNIGQGSVRWYCV